MGPPFHPGGGLLSRLVHKDQVFDFEDVRKSMKFIGRAYQKRSVAMIELCRLFLEISPVSWDQVDALKSLVDTIDNAVMRAVEAGKDRNTVADNAFTSAEEELRHYAKRYHPGYKAVLGNTQNTIHVAAKEDNDITKTRRLSQSSGYLAWALLASQDSFSNNVSH
ncbi:hypothetical protein BJY52DRAFT_529444 [Lactarius psammicola]|nr:hypothetical protein BJY52DRAFT_529444 [Lactarius psammicola]